MSNVKSNNERNVVRLLLDVKNNRYVISTLTMFIQIINIKIVNFTINNYMINVLICYQNNEHILSTIKKTCLKKFIKNIKTIMIMTIRRKKKFEKVFHEHVDEK